MKERNCSLDIFRLFAAILVVICHTHLFKDMNGALYISLSQMVPRFTVPFFFAVAGYYYIGALLNGKILIKKQLTGLIRVYAAWSLVYYAASFVTNIIIQGEDIVTFMVDRVRYFFINGSYSHMWYMVALIYAIIIFSIAYKIAGEKGIKIVSYIGIIANIVCAFGCVYYSYGCKVPGLKLFYDSSFYTAVREWIGMGVAYFGIGYFLQKKENGSTKWSEKAVWYMCFGAAILYVVEILIVTFGIPYSERPEVMLSTYILTFMIVVVLLRNPLPQFVKQAKVCKSMSTLVYFSHPLVIIILKTIFKEMHTVVLTLAVLVITCLGGYIFSKINSKITKYFM